MANIIEQVKVNDTTYNIASTGYVECESGASTIKKTADLAGFKLTKGVTIHVKFINNNTASNPSLNINGTGDVLIKQYGTTAAAGADETTGWQAGAVVSLTYDGANWIRDQGYNTNTTYTFDGTYNSSSNKAATVSTVTNAINNLDVDNATSGTGNHITGFGKGKTLATLIETNGLISATFQDIEIAAGKITSGKLSVARGGTGKDTLASGEVLIGNGTSEVSTLAIDSSVTANSNNLITSGAVASAISGLTGAMHLLGVTTTDVSSGTPSTTATVSINGSNVTATNGDVVLYNTKEFVWANDKWNLLGDEGSYALDTAVVHKSDYSGAGKILYGTGSGTYNALAANSTTTKQVLIMASSTPSWSTLGINAGTGSFPTLQKTITTEFLTASNAALTTGTAYSIPNVTKMTAASVDNNAVLVIENGSMGNNISIQNITGIDKTNKAAAATAVSLTGGSWPTPTITYN